MSRLVDSLTEEQLCIHNALLDSQWLAGLKAGWNAGCIKSDAEAQESYAKLSKSRDGHLSEFVKLAGAKK